MIYLMYTVKHTWYEYMHPQHLTHPLCTRVNTAQILAIRMTVDQNSGSWTGLRIPILLYSLEQKTGNLRFVVPPATIQRNQAHQSAARICYMRACMGALAGTASFHSTIVSNHLEKIGESRGLHWLCRQNNMSWLHMRWCASNSFLYEQFVLCEAIRYFLSDSFLFGFCVHRCLRASDRHQHDLKYSLAAQADQFVLLKCVPRICVKESVTQSRESARRAI